MTLTEAQLRTLMQANLDRIAFDDASIEAGQLANIDASGFVPLADVADLVRRPMDWQPGWEYLAPTAWRAD